MLSGLMRGSCYRIVPEAMAALGDMLRPSA
jgi:hypothetical protein